MSIQDQITDAIRDYEDSVCPVPAPRIDMAAFVQGMEAARPHVEALTRTVLDEWEQSMRAAGLSQPPHLEPESQ